MEYASEHGSSPVELARLEFSRDVLMVLLASSIVDLCVAEQNKRMPICDQMRSTYLGLLPVSRPSLVGDCLICEDELTALAPFISPGATISEIRTTPASTMGLLRLAVDFRASEYRRDLAKGSAQAKHPGMVWWQVAETLIKRFHNVSTEKPPFDDVNQATVDIMMGFGIIMMQAEAVLR